MQWRQHAALTALAILTATPLAAQDTPAPVYGPTTELDAGTDQSSRMTVPVTVDGQGPFRFIVDTGADRTVVSRELADRLKLVSTGSATLHTMVGVGSVDTVRVGSIEVGGGRTEEIRAPALSRQHLGAHGLLGVDSLQGRRVIMDFKAGTFSVADSKTREVRDPDMIVVTARSRFGQLILVDSDIGGVPITVIIDSGAENSVGNLALRDMLKKKRKVRDFTVTTMTDVTGATMSADLALVSAIRLGGFTLTNVAVAFADAHPFKRFDLLNRPAMLLGIDTLRAFRRVSVDFAQKKVRFHLPEKGSLPNRQQWFAFRSQDVKWLLSQAALSGGPSAVPCSSPTSTSKKGAGSRAGVRCSPPMIRSRHLENWQLWSQPATLPRHGA
jgi:predicted aspartyl protease